MLTTLETRFRKEFHRSTIRFLWAKHVSAIEICSYLIDDGVMRVQRVRKWRREFGSGRMNVYDDRTGWSSTPRMDVNAALVEKLMLGKTDELRLELHPQ